MIMLDLSFSPFPTIITERLLLRAITQNDAAQVYRLRSDVTAMQFLDKASFQSMEEASLLIKKIEDDINNNDGITWAIALKENPEVLIGNIGLWRFMKEHYRAEIGYMLLPEYCRKGYMKEAITQVINFSFNRIKIHSIEANINPLNLASATLLQSVGFIKEAYFKENYYYNGRFLDSAIYSLINTASY